MKFLVLVKDRPGAPPPADPIELNRRVRTWVTQQLQKRTFDCAYYVIPHSGLCIVNASSHEDLLGQLRAWPAFSTTEFEVHPLADVAFGIDNNHQRMSSNAPAPT